MPQAILDQTGATTPADTLASTWVKRKDAARADRRQYERQWMRNQFYTAGKQWLKWDQRTGRVVEAKPKQGRSQQTANVLGEYIRAIIGKLAADDFRPELLVIHDDAWSQEYAQQINDAYAWGWDEEWDGDRRLLAVLRLMTILGTGAIRCRYDRTQGPLIARQMPHTPDGKPILDPAEARAYVAERQAAGLPADLRDIREGKVVWEVLSPWNLLPPPGIEHPEDFPWEIVVRPVPLDDLKQLYGAKAANVTADSVSSMEILGQGDVQHATTTGQEPSGPATVSAKLEEHALVYTGYEKPCPKYPDGATVVFTGDGTILAADQGMPYRDEPYGPRSGLTYFRYEIMPLRFWGKAFVEDLLGPQKIRNKRLSQIDEIIDRGLPKVYVEQGSMPDTAGNPVEKVEMKTGAPMPKVDPGIPVGPWMKSDIELQDQNIEKTAGVRSVGLGQAPSGVSAYSALALLTETDAQKLDQVGKEFKLGVSTVGRDTFEAMRQWGPRKQMLLAGDSDRLQAFIFDATKLPPNFVVRPPKGGTLPRSQAAEIQKAADVWNAALGSGLAVQNSRMLQWYVDSLNAGKIEPLPIDQMQTEQRHKAALENVIMLKTGQVVPVAPYDDGQVHVPSHRSEQMQLEPMVQAGDPVAVAAYQALDQHCQMHEQQAAQNAATNLGQLGPAVQPPQLPPGSQPPPDATGGVPVSPQGGGPQMPPQTATAQSPIPS